jgi:hypothetical protein
MAIMVVYRKGKETKAEVVYHYGGSEADMDRLLVIDKASPTGPDGKGPDDRLAGKVLGKVLASFQELGRWPGGGAIQS